MNYTYTPKGVCSKKYSFQIEDGIIKECQIVGGCQGNLLGISKIIIGMPIEQVISAFEGTHCGLKPTSCPDQIAQALKAYKEQQ